MLGLFKKQVPIFLNLKPLSSFFFFCLVLTLFSSVVFGVTWTRPAGTTINLTNITNINQFDQSLNTTDNVQFQNITAEYIGINSSSPSERLTVVGNMIVQGVTTGRDIIPETTELYDIGSPTRWYDNAYIQSIFSDDITSDSVYSGFVNASKINSTNVDSNNVNVTDNLSIRGYAVMEMNEALTVLI